MSERYQAGFITKTATTPGGPGEDGAAKGVWTLDEALQYKKQGVWPTQGTIGLPGFPAVYQYATTIGSTESGATSSTGTTDEFSWVVPTGVQAISAVCIGGGGGGGRGGGAKNNEQGGGGGGGGALAYATISVTAGETLTIGVGRGGKGSMSQYEYGKAGGNSYIKRGSTFLLHVSGGKGGGASATVQGGEVFVGTGGSGGSGGAGDPNGNYRNGGGGGAGGYSGNGGNGADRNSTGTASAGAGGGGGGGGSDTGGSPSQYGGGGGGVNPFGAGSNGAAGTNTASYGNGGGGGSGGASGNSGSYSASLTGQNGKGGSFGGGGGGIGYNVNSASQYNQADGGPGCVRIVIGFNYYPSSTSENTNEVILTSNGTWTVPTGVTSVSVVCIGGGGAGNSTEQSGGGGGGLR